MPPSSPLIAGMVPASGGSAAPAAKTAAVPSTSALIAGMKPNAPVATTTTSAAPSSPLVASMKTGTSSPTTPDIASLVASTPAPKDTSGLFSGFKDATGISTPVPAPSDHVTINLSDPLASLPALSSKLSSDINKPFVAVSDFLKSHISVAPSVSGSVTYKILSALSNLNPANVAEGLTGGIYQSPQTQRQNAANDTVSTGSAALDALQEKINAAKKVIDPTDQSSVDAYNNMISDYNEKADVVKQDTAKAQALQGSFADGVLSSLAKATGAVLGIVGGGELATPQKAITGLTGLFNKFPLLAKYAVPYTEGFVKTLTGLSIQSQLNPNLVGDITKRMQTLGGAIATAPLYTAMGLIKNAGIAIPASFGLGFGMAKLSGATNEQAIQSGIVLGIMDGATRLGGGSTRGLTHEEAQQKLLNESLDTFNSFAETNLTKNSTPQEFKQAYSKAVFATHPDAGGKASDFSAMKNAYDILTNGSISKATPKNADETHPVTEPEKSIQILSKEIKSSLATHGEDVTRTALQTTGFDPAKVDHLIKINLPEVDPKQVLTEIQAGTTVSSNRNQNSRGNGVSSPDGETRNTSLGKEVEPSAQTIRNSVPSSSFINSPEDIDKYITTRTAAAQEKQPTFIKDVEKSTGITPETRIKEAGTIRDKINYELSRGRNPDEIRDVLAGRIITPEPEKALAAIKRDFNVVPERSIDYFKNPSKYGYQGHNLAIRHADGSFSELQIHTPESKKASDLIRPYYVKYRRKELTPEMQKEHAADIKEVNEKVKEIFANKEATDALEHARQHQSFLKDALADHPGRGVGKFINWRTGEFIKGGDSKAISAVGQEESNGGDLDRVLELGQEYKQMEDQLKALTAEIKRLKKEGGAPTPEVKEIYKANVNRGFASLDAIAQVADYIEQNEKNAKLAGDANDAIYKHGNLRKANRQRAIQLADSVGKSLTPEAWSTLYHYDEDKSIKITKQEQQIYNNIVIPIKTALTKSRTEFRALGGVATPDLPQDEFTPRNPVDKGGPVDRLIKNGGKNSIRNGGSLSKSIGSKHRVYHSATDEDGTRRLVAIKDKKIIAIENGKSTPLGSLKSTIHLQGKTFEGKDGKTYTLGQATTKEIKTHTDTRYHENVLANYIVAYDRQQNALSALKLQIHLINDFPEIINKFAPNETPPAGWLEGMSTGLPQFRDTWMEPHLHEILTDLANHQGGEPGNPIFDAVNNVLVSSIVLNPILHFPNVAIGWGAAQAAIGDVGVPGLTPRSRANFARAINAVKNKNALYLSYLEHGAPFMSVKQTTKEFTEAVLTQYENEVEKNPQPYEGLRKVLGYPGNIGTAFSKLNEKITWGGNDIMFLHALLDYADKTGSTPEEAIKFVSKRMADYRIPPRIFGSRSVSKLAQSKALLFGRFRFSGVIKPWIENIKDSFNPGASSKERLAGVRTLAFLGLMAYIVYPYIDKMLKGITGNNNTYLSMAGPLKVVQTAEKAIQAGPEAGVPEGIASILQLNPVLYGLLELGFNTDLYTRNPIYGGHANDESLGTFGTSMVSPLATAERMTPSQFALSLFGIFSPKNTAGANALNAQKYDELPSLEVQLKKLEAAGETDVANAKIREYNNRAIANYNNDQLDKGLPPLKPTDVQPFLKQWGVKAPGATATANAAALYGDGSLTAKSSIIDKVATYAKAIETDPITAFSRIFTGQQIVRVDNAGLLNANAAVIVERLPLASSEAVRAKDATAQGLTPDQMKGLQLDHFVPLEAGGTNEEYNLDLVTTNQNEVLHSAIETPIAAALKLGTITRAKALEYITRYKIGTLGEVPNQHYLDLYKNKYNSQPISLDEVLKAIDK